MFLKLQAGFALIFLIVGIVILALILLGLYLFLTPKTNTHGVGSTVFWDQKSDQKISKGDYLSGKGIPNAKVEIEISPANIKEKIPTNQTGNWSFKIPDSVKPGQYQVHISVLDKGGDRVTEKIYEVEIKNKQAFNFKFPNFFEPKEALAQEKRDFPEGLYSEYGFPKPNAKFTNLSDGEIYRWKKYYLPHALKAGQLMGVDFGILGLWVYFENHMMVYQDNCFDGKRVFDKLADINQNTHCPGWYLVVDGKKVPNWQVGWGIYPYESAEDFKEDFKAGTYKLHPGESLADIGNKVMQGSYREDAYWNENPKYGFTPITTTFNPDIPPDPITYPEKFPEDVSIDEIIDGSLPIGGNNRDIAQEAKNPLMRQLLGILLKDEAISGYMLARHFKQVVQEHNGRIVEDVGNWFGGNDEDDKLGAKNLQNDINLIATLYAYSFDVNEVTITNVQTTDGDGKISPGERLEVTAVCTYDGWTTDSNCQRVWALEKNQGAGILDFISPKAQAQEGLETSDIKALPGGQDCDQTCVLSIPADTQPGTYKLVVYGADGQEIFGSDSQIITVGATLPAQSQNSCSDEEYSEFAGCSNACGEEIWRCPRNQSTKKVMNPNPENSDCGKPGGVNPYCSANGGRKAAGTEFTDAEGNKIPFFALQLGADDTGTNQKTFEEAKARLAEMEGFDQSLGELLASVTDSRVRALIEKSQSKLNKSSEDLNACIQP